MNRTWGSACPRFASNCSGCASKAGAPGCAVGGTTRSLAATECAARLRTGKIAASAKRQLQTARRRSGDQERAAGSIPGPPGGLTARTVEASLRQRNDDNEAAYWAGADSRLWSPALPCAGVPGATPYVPAQGSAGLHTPGPHAGVCNANRLQAAWPAPTVEARRDNGGTVIFYAPGIPYGVTLCN